MPGIDRFLRKLGFIRGLGLHTPPIRSKRHTNTKEKTMTQFNNQENNIDQLIAQDLSAEDLDNVTAAGFTTAASFFSAGSASCPASSAGTAGSFSSAGG